MEMKTSKILLLITTVLAFSNVTAADQAKKYDFEYAIKGQPSVTPVQVFDNGTDTYFQFSPEKSIPAIFAVSSCGNKVLLEPTVQSNYVVVQGRFSIFSLQIGNKSTSVTYTGRNSKNSDLQFQNEDCSVVQSAIEVPPTTAFTAVKPTLGDDPKLVRKQKSDYLNSLKTQGDSPNDASARTIADVSNTYKGSVSTVSGASANQQPKSDYASKSIQLKRQSKNVKPSKAKSSKVVKKSSKPSNDLPAVEQPKQIDSTVTLNASNVATPNQQVPPAIVTQIWRLNAGQSIRAVIDDWRKQAGWEMVWSYDGDFTAQASAEFVGDFPKVIKELIDALPSSTKIQAELGTNRLILVSKREN